MLLERFYDEDLAQASYFIGCQAENTAVVVDARRDITEYLTSPPTTDGDRRGHRDPHPRRLPLRHP